MQIRGTQLRAERLAGDEGYMLRGYAARFNSWSRDLGGFKERIMPGCFKNALYNNADVRLLMNHDPNYLLARTKSRTLKLVEDETGLRFEAFLPKTKIVKHIFESIERGDMSQCSFAFTVDPDGDEWQEFEEDSQRFIGRTLKRVSLFDVSAVTFPAYEDTSVSAIKLSNVS